MFTKWPTLFKNLPANDHNKDTKHYIVKRKSKGNEFPLVVERTPKSSKSLSESSILLFFRNFTLKAALKMFSY